MILFVFLIAAFAGCGGKKITAAELLDRNAGISGFRAKVTEEMTTESGSKASKASYAGNLEFAGDVRHIYGTLQVGKREEQKQYYMEKAPNEEGKLIIYYYKADDSLWKLQKMKGNTASINDFFGKLQSVELQPYEENASEYVISADTDLGEVKDFGMTSFTGTGFAGVVESMRGRSCPMHAEFRFSARTQLMTSAEFTLSEPQEYAGKMLTELHIYMNFTDMTLTDLQVPEEIVSTAF